MAVALTHYSPARTTLSGTGNNMTEFNPPSGTTQIIVKPITNAAKIAYAGADDAAIGTAYLTLAADTFHSIPHQGNRRFLLASGVSSSVVEVMAVP